jgi:hypothetical protein
MRKSGAGRRIVIFLVVMVVLEGISRKITVAAGVPEATPLVTTSTPTAAKPGELRAWSVELDLAALTERRASAVTPLHPRWMRLDLSLKQPLVLEMTEARRLARGGEGWVGRWADEVPGHAVLVVRAGKVYGSLRRPGLNLHIRPNEPSGQYPTHRISEWDEDAWLEETRDFVPVWTPPDPLLGKPALLPPAAPRNPVIDILVVYTPATRSGAGGTEAIEALIAPVQ